MATAKSPKSKAAKPAKAPAKKVIARHAPTARGVSTSPGVKATTGLRQKAPIKKTGAAKETVKKGSLVGSPGTSRLMAKAVGLKAKLSSRLNAIAQVGPDVTRSTQSFGQVCEILQDQAANPALRGQALSNIQAATFDPVAFAKYRALYLSVLRQLRTDPDPEIRQRVFGLLAREQDSDTQSLLLEGLEDPSKAQLSPEKALQLLSYDPHAGAYEVARKIAQRPPNDLARREALRVLAADGNSVEFFAGVVADRSESADVRQIAASALNHLAPKRMQKIARNMAMDDSESDDARAFGLTALAHFGESSELASDAALQEKVENIALATGNASLRAAAKGFKSRYS